MSGRFEVLDGMRGIAAMMVVMLHYAQQTHWPFLYNTYLAVDVFFVLSGFVVCHAYAEKLRSGMPGTTYMARRVGRLFPLVAAGAILGWISLHGMRVTNETDMTAGQINLSFMFNIFFLPYLNTAYISQSGTQATGLIFPGNSPLWSILFELLASLAFVKLVTLRSRILVAIIGISVIALLVLPVLLGSVSLQRPINFDQGWSTENALAGLPRVLAGFTFGILIHRGWARWNGILTHRLPSFARNPLWPCILMISILTFPWTVKGAFGLVTVMVLAPLVVTLGAFAELGSAQIRKLMSFLGWLSFPLYCVHQPILAITAWSGAPLIPGIPMEVHAAAYSVVVAIALASLFDHLKLQQRLSARLEILFHALVRKAAKNAVI